MTPCVLLIKSRPVKGYVRSDGVYVKPHTDRRAPATADLFPRPESGGDQVIVFPYASGMSRMRDMNAAIQSAAGVGAVINELSGPGIKTVAAAIAAGKPFFIDSGAFQAFKAAMKAGKPEMAKLNFEAVFQRYEELSQAVCAAAPSSLERAHLMMVAPDVIGDQAATLELLEKHADVVAGWIERGHEVVVPFQRGPLKQSEVYWRVRKALNAPFIVGIPTAEAAMSNADLRELLSQPYKPDRLHILGGVQSKAFESRMAVIRGCYQDDVPGVTGDANVMRSKLHLIAGMSGEPKFEAIKNILNAVTPDIWGGDLPTPPLEKSIAVERYRMPGDPTEAQLASGKYPKRRVSWMGLTLRIENEPGTFRRGRKPNGAEWESLMHFAYGEVERTLGVDGDPVDVFLGPYMDLADTVYVIHQRRVDDWKEYDEDKCMLGFGTEDEAVAAFVSCYDDPRFLGPITAMPVAEFVAKVSATKGAPAMIKALLIKSNVKGYVKTDGTVVSPHVRVELHRATSGPFDDEMAKRHRQYWTDKREVAEEYGENRSDPHITSRTHEFKNPYRIEDDDQARHLAEKLGTRWDYDPYWDLADHKDTPRVLREMGHDGLIFDDSTGSVDHKTYMTIPEHKPMAKALLIKNQGDLFGEVVNVKPSVRKDGSLQPGYSAVRHKKHEVAEYDGSIAYASMDSKVELRDRARATPHMALNDREQLQIMLARSLRPDRAALAAAALVQRFGSVGATIAGDMHEIARLNVDGKPLGMDVAEDLRLFQNIAERVAQERAFPKTVLSSWSAVQAYLKLVMQHEPREHFRVIFLDKKNQLLADEIQNYGTVDHAPVYPREVVRRGLELNASAIIIAHNHPSGDPTPSAADIDMTRQVVDACRTLRIAVHDHMVVGREGVSSFKSLGLM